MTSMVVVPVVFAIPAVLVSPAHLKFIIANMKYVLFGSVDFTFTCTSL